MPRINGIWIDGENLVFDFPKIIDPKYGGYSVSSNICNVPNSIKDGWEYATTIIYTKDANGALVKRLESYRSTINQYKDAFLKDPSDKGVDIGKWLNIEHPYAKIMFKPDYCTIDINATPYVEYNLTYAVPVITNIRVNRKYSTKQVTVDFDANAYDTYSIVINGRHEENNTKILSESYFDIGLNTITINCTNGDKASSATYEYLFEETQPSISEFSVESANDYVDEKIEIVFSGERYNRFAVFNNDHKIAEGTGSRIVLPTNGLVIGSNRFYITLYNDLRDSKHGNFTKTVSSSKISKTLKTYTPTIKNVLLENNGNLIDNESILTWQSTYQTRANVYINDYLYKSNIPDNSITISKGTFIVGQNKVKVEVIKAAVPGVQNSETVAYDNSVYTMGRIMPNIENLVINSTNTDNIINVSWESENQTRFKLFQDSRLIAEGTGEKSVDIPPGTLFPLESDIKVIVYYDSGFDVVSVEDSMQFVGTQNNPIIYGLEPSDIPMNIDELIDVTFSTNEFCHSWELTAGGVVTRGTDLRKVSYPKNTFNKGANTMRLIINYTPNHNPLEVRKASKVVSFTGYGKPSNLVLDDRTVYTTATPTIYWTPNHEQTAVNYIVRRDGVEIENKTVITTDNFIKLGTLENNTGYSIQVRIKNSYELWSEYATKDFETNFNQIAAPNIEVFQKGGGVLIVVNAIQEDNFNGISLFRKTGSGEWLQITDRKINCEDSILDSTCIGYTQYKARIYDTLGGYADSEVKSIDVNIKNYHLANVQDLKQEICLNFVKSRCNIVTDITTKKFAGNSKPRVYKNNTNYKQCSLTVTLENNDLLAFLDFINNSEILCYRDRRGNKMFCFANIEGFEPINAFFIDVNLTLTEVNFVEKALYSGSGWRKIVYLNGSYYLDGAIDLSGYMSSDLTEAGVTNIGNSI